MVLITIFILILQIILSESNILSSTLSQTRPLSNINKTQVLSIAHFTNSDVRSGNEAEGMKINSIYSCRIAALSTLFAGFLSLNALHLEKLEKGVSIYCGLFQVSYSNLLIETLIYIIGSLVLLSSAYITTYLLLGKAPFPFGLNREIKNDSSLLQPNTKEYLNSCKSSLSLIKVNGSEQAKNYSLIALFSMLGSSLLLASSDLLSMYLSIELQSFSLYILATLYRNSGSTSAGLKYFLLGGLSSSIIILGSGLTYALTGLTSFDSLYSLISSINVISLGNVPLNLGEMISTSKDFQLGLSLGLILIFSGLLFKISAAPFHNWSLGLLFF